MGCSSSVGEVLQLEPGVALVAHADPVEVAHSCADVVGAAGEGRGRDPQRSVLLWVLDSIGIQLDFVLFSYFQCKIDCTAIRLCVSDGAD